MRWYELTLYRREQDGRRRGYDADVFEALDKDGAIRRAHRRIRTLPPETFAVLLDPAGNQIWTGEGRSA